MTFQFKVFFSAIDVLTCKYSLNITKLDKIDCNCNIDTLRLIYFSGYDNGDICMNDKLIEALNLHRNLINLTIEMNIVLNHETNTTHIGRWMKAMETILCKQYYHKLKNVNILIRMYEKDINYVFNKLKKNISILKHQFKQLNIGIKTVSGKFCTFEWNQQIDAKYLDQQRQEMNGDEMKYKQWLNQWTN